MKPLGNKVEDISSQETLEEKNTFL